MWQYPFVEDICIVLHCIALVAFSSRKREKAASAARLASSRFSLPFTTRFSRLPHRRSPSHPPTSPPAAMLGSSLRTDGLTTQLGAPNHVHPSPRSSAFRATNVVSVHSSRSSHSVVSVSPSTPQRQQQRQQQQQQQPRMEHRPTSATPPLSQDPPFVEPRGYHGSTPFADEEVAGILSGGSARLDTTTTPLLPQKHNHTHRSHAEAVHRDEPAQQAAAVALSSRRLSSAALRQHDEQGAPHRDTVSEASPTEQRRPRQQSQEALASMSVSPSASPVPHKRVEDLQEALITPLRMMVAFSARPPVHLGAAHSAVQPLDGSSAAAPAIEEDVSETLVPAVCIASEVAVRRTNRLRVTLNQLDLEYARLDAIHTQRQTVQQQRQDAQAELAISTSKLAQVSAELKLCSAQVEACEAELKASEVESCDDASQDDEAIEELRSLRIGTTSPSPSSHSSASVSDAVEVQAECTAAELEAEQAILLSEARLAIQEMRCRNRPLIEQFDVREQHYDSLLQRERSDLMKQQQLVAARVSELKGCAALDVHRQRAHEALQRATHATLADAADELRLFPASITPIDQPTLTMANIVRKRHEREAKLVPAQIAEREECEALKEDIQRCQKMEQEEMQEIDRVLARSKRLLDQAATASGEASSGSGSNSIGIADSSIRASSASMQRSEASAACELHAEATLADERRQRIAIAQTIQRDKTRYALLELLREQHAAGVNIGSSKSGSGHLPAQQVTALQSHAVWLSAVSSAGLNDLLRANEVSEDDCLACQLRRAATAQSRPRRLGSAALRSVQRDVHDEFARCRASTATLIDRWKGQPPSKQLMRVHSLADSV